MLTLPIFSLRHFRYLRCRSLFSLAALRYAIRILMSPFDADIFFATILLSYAICAGFFAAAIYFIADIA